MTAERRRRTTTGKPSTDAFIDAFFLIESVLAPRQQTQPGTTAAIRAAAHAVLRHDWLTPEDFASIYAPVEPEIPFAELK
jgi:hypothetical protein